MSYSGQMKTQEIIDPDYPAVFRVANAAVSICMTGLVHYRRIAFREVVIRHVADSERYRAACKHTCNARLWLSQQKSLCLRIW